MQNRKPRTIKIRSQDRGDLIPLLATIEDNHIIVEIDGDYATYGLEDLRAVKKMYAKAGFDLFIS